MSFQNVEEVPRKELTIMSECSKVEKASKDYMVLTNAKVKIVEAARKWETFAIVALVLAVLMAVADYICGIDYSEIEMKMRIVHDSVYLASGAIAFYFLPICWKKKN